MKRTLLACLALMLVSCGGTRGRPTAPAPEYQRPELPPWDAGVGDASDPLDNVQGEWVDDPEEVGDAGMPPAPEAGAAPAGGDGGSLDAGFDASAVQ